MIEEDNLIEKVMKASGNAGRFCGEKIYNLNEPAAKRIIDIIRDELIGGCILVPEGLYKQMRFESEQFRIEHPRD